MKSKAPLRIRIDGPVGSGKTTLMRRLAALLQRDDMTIRMFETESLKGKKRLVEQPISNDYAPPLNRPAEILIVCCEGVES